MPFILKPFHHVLDQEPLLSIRLLQHWHALVTNHLIFLCTSILVTFMLRCEAGM